LHLRIPVAIVILLALLGSAARPAAAADWTVKGAANKYGTGRESFRYTVNPGEELRDGITVVNSGAAPLHLTLRPADAFNTPAGKLDLAPKGDASKGVGAWVHLDHGDITLGQGASSEVPFSITLPKGAAPGDYVGGIVTSAHGAQAPIRIQLRVSGAIEPSLAAEHVQVHYDGTANPVGTGDATVTYTIHNTGNAILAARQRVSVSGPFGRWAVAAGKIADSPPLLPGDTWKVSAPLHGVTPALRLTATVTLVPLLTDAAGSTAPLAAIKAAGHAWTIPWSLLLAIIVVCGLVVAALALRPRRRDRASR
jgi:hypothetical protein